MPDDSFQTLKAPSEGIFTEKKSKFIAFAIPVKTVDEAMEHVARLQKDYFDARHVCWAYMIGADRLTFRANDNGEPSGTAGKPILGQIESFKLTNILIAVVRYFGGIKLGTSGLIAAYREAAREAIENGEIITCHEMVEISFTFPYQAMNDVMKLTKNPEVEVTERCFDNTCSMTLSTRSGYAETLKASIEKIDGATLS
ncbi:MAG: YigZ family protein [Muribaculaceae bacterium]|nr:YigZ family protein [Muribaculaceae bacterium]MDE5844344.1 YigZ family protein [Muribaculaceae bacterium]